MEAIFIYFTSWTIHACFQVMHMFLRQFDWISLKKQRSSSNNNSMNSNWRFEAPWWSPYRDDKNGYMECMIWSSDEEVMIFWKCSGCKNRGSDFHGSDPSLSRDFHHIWSGFFNSWKGAMSSHLCICRSGSIITFLWPNQSINCSFIFLRVRVNVALLLPQIPLPPLTHLHRR
jgi:hypothetical protein